MGKLHKIKKNFKKIDWKAELEKKSGITAWGACRARDFKWVYKTLGVNAYLYIDGRILLSVYFTRSYNKFFEKLFREYLEGLARSD